MADNRSTDSKPVGKTSDETVRAKPPFEHPNKMDVRSNGRRRKARPADSAQGDRPKSEKGPKE